MAKYYVKNGGETYIPVSYDTKEKAALTLIEAIATAVKFGNNDPTKFHIEEVPDEPEAPKDVPDLIPDYEEACCYLEEAGCRIVDMVESQKDAFDKLLTLCKAWNKADGWEPDWADREQKKWTPYICIDGDALHVHADPFTDCHDVFVFGTRERALQFGEKFFTLFEQLYGIREGE